MSVIMYKKEEVENAIVRAFDDFQQLQIDDPNNKENKSLGVLWRLIGDNFNKDVKAYSVVEQEETETV